jgi:hypothetical protein
MSKLSKQLGKRINGLSGAKKQLNALQRLDAIESSFNQLIEQLGKQQVALKNRFDNIERGIDAVAELIGREAVENKAKELHTKQLEEEAARTTEAIEAAVKAGTIEATDKVKDEQTFVVVQQKGPDGTVRTPSKIQIPLNGYVPEVKALLQDKKVGEEVTLPSGDTIIILECYQPTGKKEPDVEAPMGPGPDPIGEKGPEGLPGATGGPGLVSQTGPQAGDIVDAEVTETTN